MTTTPAEPNETLQQIEREVSCPVAKLFCMLAAGLQQVTASATCLPPEPVPERSPGCYESFEAGNELRVRASVEVFEVFETLEPERKSELTTPVSHAHFPWRCDRSARPSGST